MIIILGAVESEIESIRKHLCSVEKIKVLGRNFYHGYIGQNELVVGTSGVGKVKSAIYTQKLIDALPCACIFRLGTAGSLDRELQPMEIALGNYVTYHDYSTHLLETQYPFLTNFPCDIKVVECLASYFRNNKVKNKIGKCLSGDYFIDSESLASRMSDEYNAICVDMESAAVAECAYINTVPYVSINIITDVVSSNSSNDYHIRCFEASNFLGNKMADFFNEINILKLINAEGKTLNNWD